MFFWPLGIFSFSGRGSFFVLSAPWHAESPPGPGTQVWALAEVRSSCSGGFEVTRPLGEGFRPPRAIQAHANPRTGLTNTRRLIQVQTNVRRLTCDIWDLECRQCLQTLLDDGKVKRMSGSSPGVDLVFHLSSY